MAQPLETPCAHLEAHIRAVGQVLTRYLLEQLGWGPSELRVGRASVECRVLGVQAVMAFDPPEAGVDPEAEDDSGERRMRRIRQ